MFSGGGHALNVLDPLVHIALMSRQTRRVGTNESHESAELTKNSIQRQAASEFLRDGGYLKA